MKDLNQLFESVLKEANPFACRNGKDPINTFSFMSQGDHTEEAWIKRIKEAIKGAVEPIIEEYRGYHQDYSKEEQDESIYPVLGKAIHQFSKELRLY